tara:strand:- start:326 stop:484 length:159 start_codon:yes stop_codon:yes gene_type:complete
MNYAEEQLKFIQKKTPELIKKTELYVDTVLIEFLKKYELFVNPATKTRFKKK